MKVTFLSIDDQKNKVYFESEASKKDGEFIFLDKTSIDTTIELSILTDEVKFVRTGKINSVMKFKENKITKGYYQNDMGLEFDFDIHCPKLSIEEKRIVIFYTLILDEYMKTNHKISLLFNETLAK